MKQNVSQMNGGITRNVDVSVKNIIYFDDIINIKDFNKNNIKTDKKSYKSITHNIYYIVMWRSKNSKYVKTYSVNPLYLMLNKMNG